MIQAAIPREELVEFMVALAELAAATIRPYFRSSLAIENKALESQHFDPVTIADKAAEKAIRQAIEASYPEHSILGEELSTKQGQAPYTWVIDPIDGTRAFVCGLPTWATLIGLCHHNNPIMGLMNQPIVGDLFVGGMGSSGLLDYRGAERSIKVRQPQGLTTCTLFATTPEMFNRDELAAFDALSKSVRMTRYGVDSYAYAMLAAGQIDLVVESGLGFYDIAPLIPIIEAAGGIVSDWEGHPVRGAGRVVAAASASIHGQTLEILQRALSAP